MKKSITPPSAPATSKPSVPPTYVRCGVPFGASVPLGHTILGRTIDGATVIDRHNSHLHSDVVPVLAEALSHVFTRNQGFIEVEIDFKRVIGSSICVETDSNDRIVYAQRPNRKGHSRFVLDRKAEPSSKVMVVLKKSSNVSEYLLITAFIGGKAEVEPWDQRATKDSCLFWQNHALVLDDSILPGTLTNQCPW